jgi:hypothetical protein
VKVALDPNILASAEGTNGVDMKEKALDLIQGQPNVIDAGTACVTQS